MDPLENPIWHALATEQANLARRRGAAACFPAAVTALAGLREPAAAATADLAALLAPDETTGLFLVGALDVAPALEIVEEDVLYQMIHGGESGSEPDDVVELGPEDLPAMMELAVRTRPGPFGARTPELGVFLGLRHRERLVAMAGQRLRLPGLVEVSAVCTDPDELGRGHAHRLTAAMIARIRRDGATPFLHVRASNQRAVAIYDQVGFRVARSVRYVVVRAAR